MINELTAIKNIGRFRDFGSHGDVNFKKLTLIYAENGQGKTTLAAILRSLQSQNPDLMQERKTLGSVNEDSFVKLRIHGESIEFKDQQWLTPFPDLMVFDASFIHDHVYEGDTIGQEQRKRLYHVILGEQGVVLAKEMDQTIFLINSINQAIRENKKIIEAVLPAFMAIDTFLMLKPDPDIAEKITKKTDEIKKTTLAIQANKEIFDKPLLSPLILPRLPQSFFDLLEAELTTMMVEAENQVQLHLRTHHLDDLARNWLAQGLSYTKKDSCPYCGQKMVNHDLINAYRLCFNQSYQDLKKRVSTLPQVIEDSIGYKVLAIRHEILSCNRVLVEFWRRYVELVPPVIDYQEIQGTYQQLADAANHLAHKKLQNILEKVEPDVSFVAAMQALDDQTAIMVAYNLAVEACNKSIELKKRETIKPEIVDHLHKECKLLEAQQKRGDPILKQACDAYLESLKAKQELENKKLIIKNKLNAYCASMIPKYQAVVNDFLGLFNTGFRLANTKSDHIGGSPRAVFQLRIQHHHIDTGDAKPFDKKPTFKTTLSAGDRSAMALAFFLSLLRQDPKRKQKIVIFDDPCNNMDRLRRACTQNKIIDVVGAVQQVIVLSHDLTFLQAMQDHYGKKDCLKVLQLYHDHGKTILCECDLESETRVNNEKNYLRLTEFQQRQTGDLYEVACSIRPFLEGWLRSHYPTIQATKEEFDDFLNAIGLKNQNGGPSHANLDELQTILHYARKYHLDAKSVPIIKDELYGLVQRTLRLTSGNV